MKGKLNTSDTVGVTSTKGISRSNPRSNGLVGQGNSPKGSTAVRQNGVMPGASETDPDVADAGKYLGPKYSTNKNFRPNKTGSVR